MRPCRGKSDPFHALRAALNCFRPHKQKDGRNAKAYTVELGGGSSGIDLCVWERKSSEGKGSVSGTMKMIARARIRMHLQQ